MARTALVAVGPAAADRARLERAPEPIELIAPPGIAAELGRAASWFDGEAAAPVPQLLPGARALLALARLEPFEEIRCSPEGAWAIASAARTGGLHGCKVTIEVAPEHASLTREAALGERYLDVLFRETLLHGLRDAAAVEGDAAAIAALRAAGAKLAEPAEPPAWDAASPPAITAIVTHKDLQQYLPACLDSLRAQTAPVEILVIDDGSGPEGLAALLEEERKDPKLRVLRRENGGVGDARNSGLRAAKTELVLIVDADNVMLPRMAERLREALRLRPRAAAATCGFRAFDDPTSATLYHYAPAELSARALFFANLSGDACALHRREAALSVGGYITDPLVSEDWDLWLRYLDGGLETAPVQEVLFDYRVRAGSLLRRRSALVPAWERFGLVAEHPGLAAENARELARLAGGEQHTVERTATLAREAAAEARAASERAAGDARAAVAQSAEVAARAVDAAARADDRAVLAGERMALAGGRASRAEEAARAADAARVAAECDRDAALDAAAEARRELQALRAALEEMSSSSAVRLARGLRGLSPLAHGAVGRALRFALGLKGR